MSAAEREEVLARLNSARFADKSVAQTWATLLDEGTYLCSMSTMHRLLRAAGQAGDRRRQAVPPPRVKPELTRHHPRAGVVLGHHQNCADPSAASTTTYM